MKKYLQSILVFFLITTAGLFCGGCGSAEGTSSPPVTILAPVSHLNISSPDSQGVVRITADAGFTDGGTTVSISNPAAVTSQILDFFIRSAHAHATHTVTSNTDGSFQKTIEAVVGDTLTITYTTDGSETSLNKVVPANMPPLPTTANIEDVSVDPVTGQAMVVANNGTDGFVYLLNISDASLASTVTLPGASGASRIATDPATGETIVLDTANSVAWHITPASGGSVVAQTDIVGSSDLVAGTTGDYVIIAHTDPTPALSYFDISSDAAQAVGNSQTQGGVNQETALLVALDNNGVNDCLAVISQMADASFLLTMHTINSSVPSITQSVAFVVDVANPGGLALFNNATEALLTDSDADQMLRISLADGSATAIAVGDNPRGVVVDEANDLAYVVNNGDRTVSVVTLATDTQASTIEVGLSPTQAALLPGGTPTIVILGTGDETLTLLDD